MAGRPKRRARLEAEGKWPDKPEAEEEPKSPDGWSGGRNEKPMAMLPAELRNASGKEVDEFINHRLQEFQEAAMLSDGTGDPVRLWIARECIRLAIDPRIGDRDVRARSSALLSATKSLGLDRDVQRFDISTSSVEVALRKLRDASERGTDATREISAEIGASPQALPD